ncbi:hypothetical protein OESDEN_04842 [Oesophagostomum dentatum]|uniref:Uncharacterized protein n=1 Tax=Oesophagostomum dentatum TaxID=61180 RepID=A0A0B1TD88_OESDE|nr:hypothetical protein OESDEN_04842 [Oesophagostomum dentatum]
MELATERQLLLAPTQHLLEPPRGTASIGARPEQRDFSVVLVCAFGILMALASIMIIVGFTYKRVQVDRIRRRRRDAALDFQLPHNDSAIPSWTRNEEPNPQPAAENPSFVSTDTNRDSAEDKLNKTEDIAEKLPCGMNKENYIMKIPPKTIAAIAAIMGSSSAIIDKQLSRFFFET